MTENDIGRALLYEILFPPCEPFPEGNTLWFRARAEKSGAFAYGNGTCVVTEVSSDGENYLVGPADHIDTRYEKRSFEEMMDGVADDTFIPEATILRVIREGAR